MDKVRFGVIGTGGMGQGHCNKMQEIEEAQLTCVCDIDEKVAKTVGEKHKVPYFTKHKDLLDSGLVDAVTLATPHYFHPPIAIDAFKKGFHVLSEKPIGVTVKAADQMIAAAVKSGRVFGVMFQMRSESVWIAAKKLIDDGKIGEIYRTELVMAWFRSQAYYDSATWRATWKGEGGGVLLNQAPHILDIFTWLGGMPVKVSATVKARRHRIEVEDEAYALVDYANGATGYVFCSVNEMPGMDRIEICGEKGKMTIQGGKISYWSIDPSIQEFSDGSDQMWGSPKVTPRRVTVKPRDHGHKAIIRNVARAILYGEALIAPGVEGIRSLELANAIILSGKKKKAVKVPVDRDEYEELLKELRKTSKKLAGVRLQRVTDPTHA